MSALRRIAALALATGKDLFAGQGIAAALLVLAGFAIAGGDPRATAAAERHALLLRERVELLAILAAAAAVLAAAHAVDADRRTQAIARFATTPARTFEVLAGRTLGVVAGISALALPAGLGLLLLPESGLLRQRELFAPRESVPPAAAELTSAGGERARWQRGPALLESGSRLELRFEVERPPDWTLEVMLAKAAGDPGAAPTEWAILVEGRELARGRGAADPRVTATLREPARGPLNVAIEARGGGEVLRIDPGRCRLRGAPQPIAASVARALAGLLVLIVLASALAAALAAFVPAPLACAGAACFLLLAALRPLFLDVADALADPHARASEPVRAVAGVLARVLSLLPDAARSAAAGPLSTGAQPWRAEDLRALAIALVHALVAWAIGSAWLRRTAGRTP